MQILCCSTRTWASLDFGIHGDPGTNLQGIPRNDCTCLQYQNFFYRWTLLLSNLKECNRYVHLASVTSHLYNRVSQLLSFSFWLTSLCTIGFRFIYLISTDSNAFLLWLSNIPLYICTTTSLSIHLSLNILVSSMSWLL